MAQTVSRHNARLARQTQSQQQPSRECNCTGGEPCPVGGKCLNGQVVYRAKVTANNNTEYYTGMTGNTFKERVNKHNSDFRNTNSKHSTTLSTHIWDLNGRNIDYDLDWSLVDKAPTFNHTTGQCRLCNKEKCYIIFDPESANLNDRTELYSICRQRLRNLLSKVR